MKTVGHLDSLRGSTGGAVGIDSAPVTADHFRARMRLQPSRNAIGATIRQQVDGDVLFQIDQDSAILLTFAPSPIIDAHNCRPYNRRGWSQLQPSQNRIGAGGHAEPP
jgi:hypothetical protein